MPPPPNQLGQLLGAVRGQYRAGADAQDEQAEVTPVEAGHGSLRGVRGRVGKGSGVVRGSRTRHPMRRGGRVPRFHSP